VLRRVAIKIRRWHWGKIVILWSWGGLVVALLMTRFLSQEVGIDPLTSTISFLLAAAILVSLTVVTWIWLGGKDGAPSDQ
jgi:hypothetical protein